MTQKELDAACEWITDWIFENAPHSVYDEWMSDRADFCKAMSNSPDFGGNKTCNSDKICKDLTWQDIHKIVDILNHTAKLDKQGEMRPVKDVYTEVLQRFQQINN